MESLATSVLWHYPPPGPLKPSRNRFPELLAASGSFQERLGVPGIDSSCEEMVLAATGTVGPAMSCAWGADLCARRSNSLRPGSNSVCPGNTKIIEILLEKYHFLLSSLKDAWSGLQDAWSGLQDTQSSLQDAWSGLQRRLVRPPRPPVWPPRRPQYDFKVIFEFKVQPSWH